MHIFTGFSYKEKANLILQTTPIMIFWNAQLKNVSGKRALSLPRTPVGRGHPLSTPVNWRKLPAKFLPSNREFVLGVATRAVVDKLSITAEMIDCAQRSVSKVSDTVDRLSWKVVAVNDMSTAQTRSRQQQHQQQQWQPEWVAVAVTASGDVCWQTPRNVAYSTAGKWSQGRSQNFYQRGAQTQEGARPQFNSGS